MQKIKIVNTAVGSMVGSFVGIAVGVALISALPSIISTANVTGVASVLLGFVIVFFAIAIMVLPLKVLADQTKGL